MPAPEIEIAGGANGSGWLMRVTVHDSARTTHLVRVSQAERERYGGGDVAELVRRSFEFLLDHEPNTAILAEFDLSTIERYFPEYAAAMKHRR